MSKTARRISELAAIDPHSVGLIPTDDAVDALRFCRALARQLAAEAAAADAQPGDDNGQARASEHSGIEPDLSVVLPVYNEDKNITLLYDRLVNVLDKENLKFEILFVDDGSDDGSAQKLNDLEATDDRVHVIGLARNFGHQVAITAGLEFARGNAVAVMDADLQDPPEVLPAFLEKWREGHDVVYAVRARQ